MYFSFSFLAPLKYQRSKNSTLTIHDQSNGVYEADHGTAKRHPLRQEIAMAIYELRTYQVYVGQMAEVIGV